MRLLPPRTRGPMVFALFLSAGAVSAAPTDPLPSEIQTLEAAGRFPEAKTRLQSLKPPLDANDVKEHSGLIDKMTALFRVIDAYVQNGLTTQATGALTTFLGTVSAPRDAYLAVAVQRRLAELKQPSPSERSRLAAIEQAARDALTRADAYLGRGSYTSAKDAYTPVAALTDISDETKARARLGVAKATQLEFEDQPVGPVAIVFRSLRDGARTVLQWLLTFVSFLLPVALLLWIVPRLLLKRERSLELVDLSVPGGSAPANRELTQELQDVIDRIRGAGPGSAKLDASGFGDGLNEDGGALPAPELVFVTPAVDAPELAKQLDAFVSSTPITVGGIGLNPLQLWTLIRRLMTRRARHAFIGTLTTYDNTLTLRLTREDRLFGSKTEWRSSAPMSSAEARISCLVDIASRIVLDGQNTSTATSDCHSLKEYILGLYTLGTSNAPAALKTATAHFQMALDRDAHNWLARFQLALCARGRRDTRTAIQHLMWFAGQEAADSASLQKHIERHPDFPHVVQYQLASTLSLASEDREEPEVGRMLDGLIALETSAEGKTLDSDPDKRLRLVMLARSGQSTRDAMRCSLQRHDQVIREARQRLREHLDWFDKHAEALQRAAPTGHPLARGIVLHAYGRIRFSGGDRKGAIESLSEATALMPTYAEVHVDLAKAYLEHKGKSDWPQQVTRLLERALELDPENAKAAFVYARFYFAEETRDYAKAEPYLTAAPFDPASLFMLAQVLNNRGSYADTLGVLERAIALQEQGPTFRVRLYADSLLELVKIANDPKDTTVPKPHLRALDRARRRLCGYDNDRLFDANARTQRNYQRVCEIYAEICGVLTVAPGTCFQFAPAAPHAAAPPPLGRDAGQPPG